MPNITRGDRPGGLLAYLAGPGRHNEHVEPHLVAGSGSIMAWHGDGALDPASAAAVARDLDRPRRVHGTEIRGGHVWHCSLSLRAAEGELSEEKWAAIADDFVAELGFTERYDGRTGGEGDGPDAGAGGDVGGDVGGGAESWLTGQAACRWVAVHHGQSKDGNDHIHVAVNLVREDGSKAKVWGDYAKAQQACTKLERRYGLEVLESREAGYSMRGVTPGEQRVYETQASKTGAAETVRATAERRVRAYASAASDEAEFVRRCRGGGLLVRPRFASGRDDVVVGYSVAVRPSQEQRDAGSRPVWFAGGKLARDLTLTRLRGQWRGEQSAAHDSGDTALADTVVATAPATAASSPQVPETPAAIAADAAAVEEWRAAHRGQRIVDRAGRETTKLDPHTWDRCHRFLAETQARIQKLEVTDSVGFAHLAHDTAGVLAAWSTTIESRPGPMAQAAREMSRYSQLRAHQVPVQRIPQPGMREAAMLILHATRHQRGMASYSILIRQLAKTMDALRDHQRAARRLQAARAIETSVNRDLYAAAQQLPGLPRKVSAALTATASAEAGEHTTQALQEALASMAADQPATRTQGSPLPPDRRHRSAPRGKPGSSEDDVGESETTRPEQRTGPSARPGAKMSGGNGPSRGLGG